MAHQEQHQQEMIVRRECSDNASSVVIVDDYTDLNSNNNNNGGAAAATGGCAACACCLTCLGFFIGIPLMIAGGAMFSPFLSWLPWSLGAGIGLILSGLLIVGGAIAACVVTGVCANKASQVKQVAPQPVVVVATTGQSQVVQQSMQTNNLPQQPGAPDVPPAYTPKAPIIEDVY